MGEPVTVPLWLFLAIAAFALWSLPDRLLIPSARRQLNRLIDRLVYDPRVVAAANDHARASNLPHEVRHSVWFAARTALAFWLGQPGLTLRGRWFRFGYACVNFGGLISARDWLAAHVGAVGGDLRGLGKEQRFEIVGRLARDLMAEIARLVPVLPVSLIATALLEADRPLDELELKVRASDPMTHFEGRSAKLYLPRGDRDYALHVGLRMLALRRLVDESDGLFAAAATERPLFAYYSNAIAHLR